MQVWGNRLEVQFSFEMLISMCLSQANAICLTLPGHVDTGDRLNSLVAGGA